MRKSIIVRGITIEDPRAGLTSGHVSTSLPVSIKRLRDGFCVVPSAMQNNHACKYQDSDGEADGLEVTQWECEKHPPSSSEDERIRDRTYSYATARSRGLLALLGTLGNGQHSRT